jgi:hypothetical protein
MPWPTFGFVLSDGNSAELHPVMFVLAVPAGKTLRQSSKIGEIVEWKHSGCEY